MEGYVFLFRISQRPPVCSSASDLAAKIALLTASPSGQSNIGSPRWSLRSLPCTDLSIGCTMLYSDTYYSYTPFGSVTRKTQATTKPVYRKIHCLIQSHQILSRLPEPRQKTSVWGYVSPAEFQHVFFTGMNFDVSRPREGHTWRQTFRLLI